MMKKNEETYKTILEKLKKIDSLLVKSDINSSVKIVYELMSIINTELEQDAK